MSVIFLVGPRASGKTTVGRRLAGELGLEFLDTDSKLAEKETASVAKVIEKYGWAVFRALESEVLSDAASGPPKVVATGGGVVLSAENRAVMRKKGLVFYLSAPAEVLADRLRADPKTDQRPSLTGRSVVDEVAQVLAEREALYRDAAHQVIDAADDFEHEIQTILSAIRKNQNAPAEG